MEMNEYIVTCRSHKELQSLYNDMETEGGTLYIPNREIELLNRREVSRNTHYKLTAEEAELISNDKRVIACELSPDVRDDVTVEIGGASVSGIDVGEEYNKKWQSPIGTRKYNKDAFIIINNQDRRDLTKSQPFSEGEFKPHHEYETD